MTSASAKSPASSPAGGVFVSVAETSADAYGADLATELRRRQPNRRVWGLTGPQTRAAGCETFFDMVTGSAMLFGALRRVPSAYLMLRRLKAEFRRRPPAVAVLIDSPALNLPIARMARELGIRVLYYVAPQTWAWKERRVATIRDCVDLLVPILPFEEAYFRGHGIPVRYCGHPLFGRLEREAPNIEQVGQFQSAGDPVIVLMPGSRRQVIQEVLPGQLQVAARIRARHAGALFLVAAADAGGEDLARAVAARLERSGEAVLGNRLIFDHRCRADMLTAADLALVASGTATLEVAYRATPMLVMYNHGRWMVPLMEAAAGLFGSRLLKTRFLSLPNIIAGREIVPEFMPFYTNIEPVAECALGLLEDRKALESKQRDLAELIAPMLGSNVPRAVADELERLAGASVASI